MCSHSILHSLTYTNVHTCSLHVRKPHMYSRTQRKYTRNFHFLSVCPYLHRYPRRFLVSPGPILPIPVRLLVPYHPSPHTTDLPRSSYTTTLLPGSTKSPSYSTYLFLTNHFLLAIVFNVILLRFTRIYVSTGLIRCLLRILDSNI